MPVWWQYGKNQALSDGTVLKRFHEYECEKLYVSYSPRSGRPRTVVPDEIIDAVRLMIDDNPLVTNQHIKFSSEENSSVIYSILYDHLKLRKVCARWVSHSLAKNKKRLQI